MSGSYPQARTLQLVDNYERAISMVTARAADRGTTGSTRTARPQLGCHDVQREPGRRASQAASARAGRLAGARTYSSGVQQPAGPSPTSPAHNRCCATGPTAPNEPV